MIKKYLIIFIFLPYFSFGKKNPKRKRRRVHCQHDLVGAPSGVRPELPGSPTRCLLPFTFLVSAAAASSPRQGTVRPGSSRSMAVGLGLLVDLISRSGTSSGAAHSYGKLSAAAAAAAAAALSATGVPLSARHLYGFVPLPFVSPLPGCSCAVALSPRDLCLACLGVVMSRTRCSTHCV